MSNGWHDNNNVNNHDNNNDKQHTTTIKLLSTSSHNNKQSICSDIYHSFVEIMILFIKRRPTLHVTILHVYMCMCISCLLDFTCLFTNKQFNNRHVLVLAWKIFAIIHLCLVLKKAYQKLSHTSSIQLHITSIT